ncbi:MAG TPA: hypothetical protein VGJ84_11845, partial [Polyangiaceae bacterium]
MMVISLWATRVMAQTSASDKAAAEALFEQGRTLLQEGKPEQACAKLEASQQLDAGVGTLLYLADCYQRVGRSASAWATFLEAASMAKAQGQVDRQKLARERAAALEPKLSRLSVAVPDASRVAGLEVHDNGRVIAQASWGVALPVDPGPHRVEVMAPNRETWSKSIEIPPDGSTQQLEVPALRPAPVAAGAKTDVSSPTKTPASPARDVGQGSGQRTLGLALGAGGVVGVGVGSVFGLIAINKNKKSLDHCTTDTLCSQQGVDLRNQAKSAATVSTIAFAAGGAMLGAGLILYLTAPSTRSDAPQSS